MTAYKVLKSRDGKLQSAILSRRSYVNNEFCIDYPLDEWVKPKIGKLFVFESLESARDFIGCYHLEYIIYEVETMDLEDAPKGIVNHMILDSIYLKPYWEENNFRYTSPPPRGTKLCSQLKLIKEIK